MALSDKSWVRLRRACVATAPTVPAKCVHFEADMAVLPTGELFVCLLAQLGTARACTPSYGSVQHVHSLLRLATSHVTGPASSYVRDLSLSGTQVCCAWDVLPAAGSCSIMGRVAVVAGAILATNQTNALTRRMADWRHAAASQQECCRSRVNPRVNPICSNPWVGK